MKIFAIINQKGGTGKTTVSLNLAARLSELGRRVLLVDADPQGNATSGSGVNKWDVSNGLYDALHGEPLEQCLVYSLSGKYYVIGANMDLAGAELDLSGKPGWQNKMRDALSSLQEDFDFAIIDCPPSLGLLTVNALVAAEKALIPMQCEYFAMEGLSDLAETVRRLRLSWNPDLAVAGIVRAIVDSRNVLSRNISEELEKHFGDKVFSATIGRNVRVAEAPSHRMPVLQYAPHSSGAEAYRQLGDEFLERFS